MGNKKITIIINTFRSEDKINNCLDTISIDYDVIIVENSNNNSFKNEIEKKYPNVKCVLTGENLGYAKGNNLGLSLVKTKYALIINPDATVQSNTIENFIQTAKLKQDFAIIAPFVQEKNQNNLKGFRDGITEVKNVKGFAMFLNLEQFRNIGFFDENFFIYFEEIDLCKRLIQNKKKIFLDTNIIISHAGGTSHEESINYEMEKSRNWHWMWSTFYFHKKHYGYFIALIKILPKFLSAIVKLIYFTFTSNKEKKDIYRSRFNGILNSILLRKSWYRPKIY